MHKLILFLLAVLIVQNVVSESENEIKRGTFPYMAFIYYQDNSVTDKNGNRITRAGILVKLDWLITSSLETDVPMAFPKKTLVARLGSVAIDKDYNINEDEDEQEREIIQIIRPHEFSAVEWWNSDISLLKTLSPFTTSSTVAITTISPKLEFAEKECFILVYARKTTNITDRILLQIPVDITALSSSESCGKNFKQNTMICAMDIDDKKNIPYSSNYCQGNSGGPLICENDVYGLQTYIDGCQEPHLYQVFSGWANFISCGIQEICDEKQCAQVCTIINKDTEKYTKSSVLTTVSERAYKEVTTTIASSKAQESNLLVEESSPERPTETTVKEDEVTTTTHSMTTVLPESSPNTPSPAEVEVSNSVSESEDPRRSNVEAQQEPVAETKSTASTLIPISINALSFFWISVHFI